MGRRMPRPRARGVVLSAAALLAVAYAAAPDTQRTAPRQEHAVLEMREGTWDAAVEIPMGPPGAAPHRSKGTETARLCCGGLWLLTDFKNDPGSEPFEGHGITGYDTAKKQYVYVWVDTEVTATMISEGAWDAATRTMTLRGSMQASGKTMRWRDTDVWKDDDTRQFTMYRPGPDGKETPTLVITYTRRK